MGVVFTQQVHSVSDLFLENKFLVAAIMTALTSMNS